MTTTAETTTAETTIADTERTDATDGIVVNGVGRALRPGTTVADVVTSWCPSPEGIAVARNRAVVPRSEWATTPLSPRDVVEIVTAAAGG